MSAPADLGIAATSVPDAGAFLARLVRFDPAALVRRRPAAAPPGAVTLWGRLPFDVLVCRTVDGAAAADDDVTVRADQLLAALPAGPLPPRRDLDWRGGLPPSPGPALERVPAAALRRVADAAADTLRDATGRGIGQRRVRDAILDHVAITLTVGEPATEVAVPTRVVTALVRMGFLGEDEVRFGVIGPWLVAHATFGSAWYRASRPLQLDVTDVPGQAP